MLVVILIAFIVLAMAGWGPAYSYRGYGYAGGAGWVGLLLIVLLLLYFGGFLH